MEKSKILTSYAVETRYPGDYAPVSEDDYKKAVKAAEIVFKWVEQKITT